MGLAFAAGWSPCIGPILASILLMAAKKANMLSAALLLVAYSIGFAVPFVASALFFEKLSAPLNFLKKHAKEVRIISGLLLIIFGILMVQGSVSKLSASAVQLGNAMLNFEENSRSIAKAIGIAVWIILALFVERPFLNALSRRTLGNTTAKDERASVTNKREQPQHPQPRALLARHLFAGFFLLLAALEITGTVSLVAGAGQWLMFGGL